MTAQHLTCLARELPDAGVRAAEVDREEVGPAARGADALDAARTAIIVAAGDQDAGTLGGQALAIASPMPLVEPVISAARSARRWKLVLTEVRSVVVMAPVYRARGKPARAGATWSCQDQPRIGAGRILWTGWTEPGPISEHSCALDATAFPRPKPGSPPSRARDGCRDSARRSWPSRLGLSPDYYSRLEQGRQANVSDQVLDAIAAALRLDDTERAHLHHLAAPLGRRPDGRVGETAQRPDPGLLRIMATLDHVPVLLLGHRGDVLARNALLPAVLGRPLEPGTSFTRYLFLDPRARERILNWEVFARNAVAALRLEAGKRRHDRLLHQLIDELRAADADVAAWWEDHAVRDYASVTKHIRHPDAGELVFGIEAVEAPNEPNQRLTMKTVLARRYDRGR